MGTNYLYGTILTGEAVAANNRGDTMGGNTTTLQKVFYQDDLHTSVSAEAIRFALRYRFQLELGSENTNRTYHPELGRVKYKDDKWEDWKPGPNVRIDDDLMGFMNAAAAKKESEVEESIAEGLSNEEVSPKAKGKKAKGKPAIRRPSPLAVGRAVSLRPY